MNRTSTVAFIALLPLSISATLYSQTGLQSAQMDAHAAPSVALASYTAPVAASMPAAPKGRSTVIGGEIRNVDPVRDQFALKVFGGHTVKVAFDERTQVYRDGVRISVLDLHPDDHASVETTLDGTTVFAVRIHMLSMLPEDETRARVAGYNPQTGELTLYTTLSHQPMNLRIPAGMAIGGLAANSGSAIATNSLVDVKFRAGNGGHNVATAVNVLATPGAAYVFTGDLAFFDLHAGRLTVVDPRDSQRYEIVFNPSQLPAARDLHTGSPVRVATSFDGNRYVANQITAE